MVHGPWGGGKVVWNGPTADTEAALHFFHADQAFPMAALPKVRPTPSLPSLTAASSCGRTGGCAQFVDTILEQSSHVYYDKDGSGKLHHSLPALSAAMAGGRIQSPRPILHLMRWRKSEAEVRLIRRATSIACQVRRRHGKVTSKPGCSNPSFPSSPSFQS